MKNLGLIIIIALAVFFGYRYLSTNTAPEVPLEERVVETETTEGEEKSEVSDTPEGAYQVNTEASTIAWVGKKPIYTREGTVSFESGYINENYEGEFAVQMSSITSQFDGLTDALKGQDFFDVINFPQATLTTTGYVDGELKGTLNVLGISEEVSIPAEVNFNENSAVIVAQFMMDRTDFGIQFGSGSFFENLGDQIIDDEVELNVSVVAER
jgi:polyisoprenoid-binding protein YceI